MAKKICVPILFGTGIVVDSRASVEAQKEFHVSPSPVLFPRAALW